MAAATAMRLVPPDAVPRALSIVFGGFSVATVVTGPLGSLLGDYIGWRGVYLVGAGVGVIGLGWQYATLPGLPSSSNATLATLLHVLKRRQIVPGIVAALLVFTGHFAFFTYLRPFLETVTRVHGSLVSGILLAFGIANVVGTAASGWLLSRGLRFTLAIVPAGFAVIAFILASLGGAIPTDTLLVALWGFGFGAVPVAWTTWVTRTVPDEAESGSGLLVAAIQLAMAIGAGAGGIVFDRSGISGVFVSSAAASTLAVLIILVALRQSRAATG